MLSTDIRQESMVKRIENIVSILMEEDPLFKERGSELFRNGKAFS
jgi:hypothetical protein